MPDMPAAEVVVDEALVRRLLRAQHPDLADLPLLPLAHGWDNALVRLGEDLLVRLPRRAAGVPLMEHEQRWVPELARHLPLPVPVPVRVGRPGEGYPWPWSVVPYLDGRPAPAPEDLDAPAVARQLGELLGLLHRPAHPEAPANPVRGIPLAGRVAAFEETAAHAGDEVDVGAVRTVFEDGLAAAPYDGVGRWLHGDLHPANLLVRDGLLSGVVDFGDVTAGDPACDLAGVWMLLPVPAHERFWAAYAAHGSVRVDDALRRRTRGWAAALGLAILTHSADNPTMAVIARRTLSALLA